MYNPISNQFLRNLKESQNFASKKCIAPLVGRLALIFLAVENVEKRGARDPAGWSRVSAMCVAQVFSFQVLLDQNPSVSIFRPMQRFFLYPFTHTKVTKPHDYENLIFFP
jgi:hypothetical protein